MANINDAFPSKYLKAGVDVSEPILAKMGRTEYENIGDDRKLILHLDGMEKGLVLNKTNANSIAKLYGDETEDWRGKEIVLFETAVDFRGESVPAIRVRGPKKQPTTKKPVVDDDIPF